MQKAVGKVVCKTLNLKRENESQCGETDNSLLLLKSLIRILCILCTLLTTEPSDAIGISGIVEWGVSFPLA